VEFEGWLLDAYAENGYAVTWFVDKVGRPMRARFRYRPDFYVYIDEEKRASMKNQIECLTGVVTVDEVMRREAFSSEAKTVLRVTMADTTYYGRIVKRLKRLKFPQLYNTHLLHAQRVLFQLGLEPGSKALVNISYDGSLQSVTKIDDRDVLPPPFKMLSFKLIKKGHHSTEKIELFNGSVKVDDFTGEPNKILFDFASAVRSEDPDILICNSCEDTFAILLGLCRLYGLNLQLGRDRTDIAALSRALPYWTRGRVVLDEEHFNPLLGCWGLAGILERSRFGIVPLNLAAEWTSNRLVDSRNSYELLQRDCLIPAEPKFFEYGRDVREIGSEDKGAMIIPPVVGVHSDVGELDFESEFANIIIKRNISYESLGRLEEEPEGLLPSVIGKFLDRRLYFKHLRKSLRRDSVEMDYCEQRQTSLKLILCVLYGTSGCAWNRFGNVLAFEKINSMARDIMLESIKVAEGLGFRTIYADTDSIFIKKGGATEEDYEAVADAINKAVKLPIALDHHYRYLVLLPRKADARTTAFKRYYGLTYSDELVCRGIEHRRRDTPLFIKEVQEAMMRALLSRDALPAVYSEGFPEAVRILNGALKQLKSGQVNPYKLIISKALRRDLDEYVTAPPHVSAARRMEMQGEEVRSGSIISFIYTDNGHKNPLCRAVPSGTDSPTMYDTDKYVELMTMAAKTILTPFLTKGIELTPVSRSLDAYFQE